MSDGVTTIVKYRKKCLLINYLDDYLFAASCETLCDWQIRTFLDVCKEISLPVSERKTHWSSTFITFLGFLVDRKNKFVLIPLEKLQKENELVDSLLCPKKKKFMILKLQHLSGFLNFLCRCVVPGRAFTGQIYALIDPKLK